MKGHNHGRISATRRSPTSMAARPSRAIGGGAGDRVRSTP